VDKSPAFGAGIKTGDLLVSLNGKPIKSSEALSAMLRGHRGSVVKLVVWSKFDGAPRDVKVALH